MHAFIKLAVGAAATAALAMVSHSWLGMGAAYIDGLDSDARTALGNAGGVGIALNFVRDPALQRIAILSGDADEATRARLIAAVADVPGVAQARWATDTDASTASNEAPATTAQVDQCQTSVDAAIAANPAIQFRTGSAQIDPASSPVIDAITAALTPCGGTRIEVGGHTDAAGNPASNQTLSQARAEAVMAALVAKGIPADRLVARGYGSSQPAVEGRGAAADAANRRTSFAVASNAAAGDGQ